MNPITTAYSYLKNGDLVSYWRMRDSLDPGMFEAGLFLCSLEHEFFDVFYAVSREALEKFLPLRSFANELNLSMINQIAKKLPETLGPIRVTECNYSTFKGQGFCNVLVSSSLQLGNAHEVEIIQKQLIDEIVVIQPDFDEIFDCVGSFYSKYYSGIELLVMDESMLLTGHSNSSFYLPENYIFMRQNYFLFLRKLFRRVIAKAKEMNINVDQWMLLTK